jgi:hypothetical protein
VFENSLDRNEQESHDGVFKSGKIASIFANDVVLLQVGPNQTIQPDPLLYPILDELHTVTLRLSGVDEELVSSREEIWIDEQIENLSETYGVNVDLALLLGKIPRLFLNPITLRSLTYLKTSDDQNNEMPIRGEDPSCSLSATDGGSRWLLSIGARRICSARIPLARLKFQKATSSSRIMYGINRYYFPCRKCNVWGGFGFPW